MTPRRWPWWSTPLLMSAIGVGALTSFWIGGNRTAGLICFVFLLIGALAYAVGGRFEAVRALRGDGKDEYWRGIDGDATRLAGLALMVAVVAMLFWEWSEGRDGTPYFQLLAVPAVAYSVALAALRLRR